MNPMQMLQGMRNPQQFLQQMMGDRQMMSNPIIKNALGMVQSGNAEGIEKLARNLCKEKGIQVDDFVSQIKQNIGL
ncbi:hypothetical protein [Eshraghiella crossota]|uniref:hypothetical protein n=1 Tax=Eshraghiella crossota TaxID=45851 RepID=UPI004027CFDD